MRVRKRLSGLRVELTGRGLSSPAVAQATHRLACPGLSCWLYGRLRQGCGCSH